MATGMNSFSEGIQQQGCEIDIGSALVNVQSDHRNEMMLATEALVARGFERYLELGLLGPQADHDDLIGCLCLLQGSLLGRHHLCNLYIMITTLSDRHLLSQQRRRCRMLSTYQPWLRLCQKATFCHSSRVFWSAVIYSHPWAMPHKAVREAHAISSIRLESFKSLERVPAPQPAQPCLLTIEPVQGGEDPTLKRDKLQ